MSLVALACPRSKRPLTKKGQKWVCDEWEYPEIDGTPVLFNDDNSLFNTADISSPSANGNESKARPFSLKRAIVELVEMIPEPNGNFKGPKLVAEFVKMIEEKCKNGEKANVLIIGAGERGSGQECVEASAHINLMVSDVSLGGDLVCDIHDLPFLDESIDAVICQAVLEHVIDPVRGVSEIRRVLKPDGLAFVSVPFMQQVHMGGRYDYTRFTNLGLRSLMSGFAEIQRGALCGPGMALSWAIRYFLLSLSSRRSVRALLDLIGRKITAPIKLMDYLIIDTPGAIDAASANYFIGQKSTEVLPIKEIPQAYIGGI